jgi:hypothetical protein
MIRSSTSTCGFGSIAALAGFQTQPGYLNCAIFEASGLVPKSRGYLLPDKKACFTGLFLPLNQGLAEAPDQSIAVYYQV